MTKENLERVKLVLKILVLISGFGAAIGGVLVFLYCFAEGIVPKNLTLSDSFILLYALFSFFAIYAIGLLYGTFSVLWLVRLIQLLAKAFGQTPNASLYPEMGGMAAMYLLFLVVLLVRFLTACRCPSQNAWLLASHSLLLDQWLLYRHFPSFEDPRKQVV
jgi:hypothetical protein